MYLCTHCHRDVRLADSCRGERMIVGGTWFKRLPFGREDNTFAVDFPRCPQCNVEEGGLHHPGCTIEECPRCHEVYMHCPCTDAPDETTNSARCIQHALCSGIK